MFTIIIVSLLSCNVLASQYAPLSNSTFRELFPDINSASQYASLKNSLGELLSCLGMERNKYGFAPVLDGNISVWPKDARSLDFSGMGRTLFECWNGMDGGYDIILSSSNGDYGPNYEDNDSVYSGPIGNGLDPISGSDSEEPEEDIPLTCLDTPSDSFSSNSTTVAATEKKRTETGFGKRTETGFGKRTETGFGKRTETGFVKRTETGFVKRTETGFGKVGGFLREKSD